MLSRSKWRPGIGKHRSRSKTARHLWLVVAALLAACSTAEPLGPPPVVDEIELETVYDAVNTVLTQEQQVEVMNAIDTVVEQCMRQAGYEWFDYPGVTVEQVFANDIFMSDFEVWLFNDPEMSGSDGYGVVSDSRQIRAIETPRDEFFTPEMTPEDEEEYYLAFAGTEEERITIRRANGSHFSQGAGGCLGVGLRTMHPDLETYLRLNSVRKELISDLWTATIESAEVQASLAIWAECMRKEGYAFQDPPAALEAVLTVAADSTPNAAQAVEVSIASKDVGCKELSGLSGWFSAVFLREAEARLSDHMDDLTWLSDAQLGAARRAAEILSDGS
ncbi:MAG: hypothetical protein R3258_06375 [Acidimicrobiia bacterium]|nr:hypothetical protein [Acidimicrobiia bacterium]